MDAVTESRISNEHLPATAQDPDQIVRQGRVARSARAAKAITQIDFTGLDAAVIMGEDGSGQQEQAESPTIGQVAMPSSLGHQESSDHEREAENMEPREYMSDSREPAASDPSIGESTDPPGPAALQNTAATTGEGGPSQQEQTEFQTTHHDMASPVPKPQEPTEHDRETNKKKPREYKDDSREAPAPGPSVSEFAVLPLPEALRPHRNPPPDAITITFKAYEHGG